MKARRIVAAPCAVALLNAVVAACSASRGAGELEPRYVAVHNTLAAMGLVQVGPIQQGTLGEGREARVTFDLLAQCTTIVGIGGDGVRDIDLALLDTAGKPIAHDTTREPQAVLRACVDTPGTYTLAVKMASGGGPFVAGTWSGSVGTGAVAAPAASGLAPVAQGAGTCESPIALAAGTVNGSTGHGENLHEGTCGRSDSKEIVYRLDVRERQHVSIDVHPRFDAVLYVRKDDCAEGGAEVACNDDAPGQDRSKLDMVLDPGTYFVFVDGYGHESGSFRMSTTLAEIPPLADVCRRARPLVHGAQLAAQTSGSFDNVNASCGDGAKGLDSPYKLDVTSRSRVRVTQHSSDFKPVVHLRRACVDEQSEVGCADDGLGTEDATFVGVLDPGSYTVFGDAKDRESTGRYTIVADVAPENGSGVAQGDSCSDAIPLSANDKQVMGDTFAARDDLSGRCGGAGAGDVVYRVDLTKRSRLQARVADEEGHHVLFLQKSCGDRASEVVCAPRIDETLSPGSYYLIVDGATAGTFGKYQLELKTREMGGQEAACRSPQALVEGQTLSGSTSGQGDKWATSCAGREDAQSSSDRMYKLELRQRTRVRLVLTTPTWDGVLALRKTCLDTGATVRASEVACNNDSDDSHHSKIEQTLEPGTYFVLVDGHASGNEGAFTLEYKAIR